MDRVFGVIALISSSVLLCGPSPWFPSLIHRAQTLLEDRKPYGRGNHSTQRSQCQGPMRMLPSELQLPTAISGTAPSLLAEVCVIVAFLWWIIHIRVAMELRP